MREQSDAVGGECGERIRNRLQRVALPGVAGRLDAISLELLDCGALHPSRPVDRIIGVAHPELQGFSWSAGATSITSVSFGSIASGRA